MSTPIILVSHLPSAGSFYAAITQPLGIVYLSASPSRLHFGFHSELGPQCVFTLQQSPIHPPRPSQVLLLAHSHNAVECFYKKSLLANNSQTDHCLLVGDEETRAKTRDLDGNRMEALYSRRPARVETASTSKEARRVLEWQQEVARSVAAASEHSPSRASPTASAVSSSYVAPRERASPRTYQRSDSYPPVSQNGEPLRLVRRETVTTEAYRRPSEGGGGFNSMKLVGTLLGAAAGAAVAYAMVSSDSSHSRPHPTPRRASYGDRKHATTYSPVVERIPARSYVSRDTGEQGYVEQYTIAAAPPKAMKSIEERSYTSRRERSRSETRYERPLTIRARSPHAGSHMSHRTYRSDEKKRSSHHSRRDDSSYVSARTHRTETERAVKPSAAVQYLSSSQAVVPKMSTTTIRVMPKDERERRSLAGGRSGGGYAASVAPSDSVSSVGSKRERERLMDRMRERW